jgi:hypothetical protein
MPSDVEIANAALAKIGHDAITSFLDDSDEARAINALYAICRDEELATHPWNFATEWAALALITGAPANPNFDAQYQLPTNYLKVWSLGEDWLGWPWIVEGTRLLTDVSDPVVQITKRVTDSAQFSAPFVMCLTYRLAMELCNPLTARRGNAQDHERRYKEKRQEARTSDGQESSAMVDDDNPLAVVRNLSGTDGAQF